MYLQKVICRKNCLKNSFLLATWRSMTEIAGSGATLKCHGPAALITIIYLGKEAVDEGDPGAPELLHEWVHVELDLESGWVALHPCRAACESAPATRDGQYWSWVKFVLRGWDLGWVVRASDSQWRSRNCPGFDPSILRHSGIWGAADEAFLNKVQKNPKRMPLSS